MTDYDKKYGKLLEQIKKETVQIKFNETLAEKIIELENISSSNALTFNEWDYLYKQATEYKNNAVLCALAKCEHLPLDCLYKLYAYFETTNDVTALLMGSHIPNRLIDAIAENTLNPDLVIAEGSSYDKRVIDYLCRDIENRGTSLARYLDYAPFYHLEPNSKTIEFVNEILENKDDKYFDGEVPYSFAKAIVCNDKMPNSIRDKAFSIGYDPYNLNNTTSLMDDELYKMYADTVFDVDETSSVSLAYADTVVRVLSIKMQLGKLKESHQIDFIDRFIANGNESAYKVATKILENTNIPDIALKMLEFDKSQSVVPIQVKKNPKVINAEVMEKLLLMKPCASLQKTLIDALFYHPMNDYIMKNFEKYHDVDINRAIILSDYTSKEEKNSVLKYYELSKKLTHKKIYKELKFLFDLQNTLSDNTSRFITRDLVNNVALYFINDGEKTTRTHHLIDRIKQLDSVEMICLNAYEFNKTTIALRNLKERYGDYPEIFKMLKYKLERLYQSSDLMLRYDVFERDNFCTDVIKGLPFNELNSKELYNLTESEIDNFIKYIQDFKDVDVANLIKEGILDLTCNFTHRTQDVSIKSIYRFSELYNICDDIIEKSKEKNKEEYIKSEKEEYELT